MKTLRNIFTNPLAIAVAVVHWVVALFAIYFEQHTQPFHFYYEPLLTQVLLLLNFPALILTGIIGTPIAAFWQETEWTNWLLVLVLFFFVSLQWLIIGYAIANLFDPIKPKELKFR